MTQAIGCRVEATPGNTPITHIPDDYMPAGSGRWLILPEGPDAGKKLFFYDHTFGGDGKRKVDATLVFVHGNPESSYTYSQVITEVERQAAAGKSCRVVAMDHIGFGLSDQASFEMVDMHHANNLKQLIAHLNLTEVTLVIHDWGGAIGTGAFIDTPERVKHLVLMNTTIFPMPLQGMNCTNFPMRWLPWNTLGYRVPWRLWKHIPPIVMFSSVGPWKMITRTLDYTLRAISGRLTEGEVLYRDMFKTRSNALSSKRNVKQTKVWGHGYRYFDKDQGWQDNRAFYQNMQKKVPECWGPSGQHIGVRGFWGEWDPCARAEVREQWQEALPQLSGHMQTFPEVGHFVEEHKFVEIAAGIVEVSGLG
ncbi:hypothetical protein R50073_46500 [Maricurvus nonylphenolicus]|uniref:alpha/beta hydrolase n=1 Tax=Maricurvus nonylphenolicus TaxID=1008307 RepID=UPI0036F43F93